MKNTMTAWLTFLLVMQIERQASIILGPSTRAESRNEGGQDGRIDLGTSSGI